MSTKRRRVFGPMESSLISVTDQPRGERQGEVSFVDQYRIDSTMRRQIWGETGWRNHRQEAIDEMARHSHRIADFNQKVSGMTQEELEERKRNPQPGEWTDPDEESDRLEREMIRLAQIVTDHQGSMSFQEIMALPNEVHLHRETRTMGHHNPNARRIGSHTPGWDSNFNNYTVTGPHDLMMEEIGDLNE